MTFVSSGGPTIAITLDIQIYWATGGSCPSTPPVGQTFAEVSNYALSPKPTSGEGYTIPVPAVGGTVSRVFDADDVLCVRVVNNAAPGNDGQIAIRTDIAATSGEIGVRTSTSGSLVRNP